MWNLIQSECLHEESRQYDFRKKGPIKKISSFWHCLYDRNKLPMFNVLIAATTFLISFEIAIFFLVQNNLTFLNYANGGGGEV